MVTPTNGRIVQECEGGPVEIEVRSFAPSCGVNEDPFCGSGNGAVAPYRLRGGDIGHGHAYAATQGARGGRNGLIQVRVPEGGLITIGGACAITVSGALRA